VTITLLTYDADDDADDFYTITALPSSGTLHAPSTNWLNFGYEPIKGAQITAVPFNLNSNTLVYSAPEDFSLDLVKFKVTSTDAAESNVAYIDITSSTRVYLESPFNVDEEDWQVVAASSVDAPWSSTSTALLNHYIYAGEIDSVLGANNNVRWYFEAPVAFHGDHPNLVGGTLAFSLHSFAGSFDSDDLYAVADNENFVELLCSSCGSKGYIFAQRVGAYTGGSSAFTYTLSPDGGWLMDPHDSRVTEWSAPSKTEFLEMVRGLDGIRVYGDITTAFEAVGMDSFTMTAGEGVTDVAYYA
jgi:hypothetical protein